MPGTRPRPALLRTLATPRGAAVAAGLLLLALVTAFGPALLGDAADTRDLAARQQGASLAHPFGTDDLGRDLLARVLVATRLSVLLALGATAISVVGGAVVGIVAAVLPAALRRAVNALVDILLSFPWLLLALFFSVIWGTTATGAMLAVGFAGVPVFARLVSTLAASVAGTEYVHAARMLGSAPLRTARVHLLPNVLPPLLVNAAAHASVSLLSFAALSFLGLGVQAPAYDWGRLLNEGARRIYVDPMAAVGPGLAIVLTGVLLALLGEVLSEGGRRRGRAGGRPPRAGTGVAPAVADDAPVVDVRDLRVAFAAEDGSLVERVHGVDLRVAPREVVGLVGESGSGKSVTAMAVAGLLGPDARVRAERLVFRGIDMTRPPSPAERTRLGLEQTMIFQDPLSSLNPSLTVGRQLTEVTEVHARTLRAAARARALAALERVRVPEAARRLRQLPHELSGGMRQRVMIATGLMVTPRLIVADEPTTALDVTVQRQVLGALRGAQRETGAAILLISHDIALVSGFCDRVVVMRSGRVVEELDPRRWQDATHPYTRGLIACVPDMTTDRTRPLPVVEPEAPDDAAPALDPGATDRSGRTGPPARPGRPGRPTRKGVPA
ncbi:dipeptide/oligopeptide/nickel ABC transporter permease/ATP-binding protein [Cellulomonas triticagri]|uniref:ATP-binding cassette domain-containing protein n=1 Tax=Cellulomonas triticagri TaxID=2483352 RepID=A0A3M2JSF5_9CELL|nr:dipeptide/oligopeptide/nickel ABC transporter permease/ATP-binding protein [Cellulomonas triticagri]RMI13665.1 ATP-binding cassette domain-containing protein [Cellulomonas triticagri]